jgi:ATP-dependent Lon protease
MSEPEPEYQVVVSAEEQAQAEELGEELPATLPVLPLKETVVFPESMTPLAIGQERSVKLIDDVIGGDRLLALVTVRADGNEPDIPDWDDLYGVGTAAVVHKMIRVPDGTLRVLVQGLRRISLERRVLDDPYLVGEFVELPDVLHESKETEALTRNVQGLFARIIGLVPYLPEELQIAAANVDDPTEDRGEAEAARARRRRRAAARGLADPEPRARGVRARHEDPVAGAV